MAFCEEIKTKEELFDYLTSIYDVEESTAENIIYNLASRHRLSEAEEILLESYGIERDFIASIQANKNLNGYADESLVGPFFYINKKLRSHSVPLSDSDYDGRFYNDPISHFDFFNTLGINGDYGNYPRGRVIFDGLSNKFIVYVDKSLKTPEIKQQIKETYKLYENLVKVVFRFDSHYTHDGL